MSELLLEVKDLNLGYKVYNGIAKVLTGLNIKVGYSEKIGIVGETGCGKTTAMRSIMRTLANNALVAPESKIFFQGKDILKMNNSEVQDLRRENISMVFEDPTASLNPVFTVGTQLSDIVKGVKQLKIKNQGEKKLKKESIKKQVVKIFKSVYLPDPERIYQSFPVQLSGGMRQRVCIAMALISSKELLIFDEPGTSLDVTIKDQIFKLIKSIIEKGNASIILISHDLGDIKHMSDRVYIMYAGSIIEEAETRELFNKPLHPYTEGLLLATPKLTGGIGQGIFGNIPSYLDPPKGCRFYPRCKDRMPICAEKVPPMININNSHRVACFLFNKDKGGVTINENR